MSEEADGETVLCSCRTNVAEPIGNIHAEGELDEAATCRETRQVRVTSAS